MDIQLRPGEDCTTVDIRGRLDAVSAPVAEETLIDAIQAGVSRLVINLGDTDYVSSAGLRVLVATAKRLSRQGGQMVLCELQSEVRQVFEISGLLTIFAVADTEATAYSLVMA
jgi:anti-anti-sigma factor